MLTIHRNKFNFHDTEVEIKKCFQNLTNIHFHAYANILKILFITKILQLTQKKTIVLSISVLLLHVLNLPFFY